MGCDGARADTDVGSRDPKLAEDWVAVPGAAAVAGRQLRDVSLRVVDGGEDFDDVLAAARLGAEWALIALYRDIQPRLVRYLHAHAAGEEEDLASEVWLQVAQGLVGFEGGADDFRRFLFTIARRRAIDYHRKRARRRTDPADSQTMGELRGPANTEVSVLEQVAGGEAVDRILALLSAEQAEVILLRVVAGLSVTEVAQVIGRRPAAVSVLQHRALRRLADRLVRPTWMKDTS